MFTAALLLIALNYTNNVILIKKEVTVIKWMNRINSGPKKLHTKEYSMTTLISNSKVNKTTVFMCAYCQAKTPQILKTNYIF